MFFTPKNPQLHLPRLFLFLLPLLGAFSPSPSEGAEPLSSSKQQFSIPPGMSELDLLQADYETASKDLEAHFLFIQKNAAACPNGATLAGALKGAAPSQANQRKKIVDSLNNSKLELQNEVTKLDGAGFDADASSVGAAIVATSKSMIAAGVAKPLSVIAKEQKKIKTHNDRMGETLPGASLALEGSAPKCTETHSVYFEKMRPLALAIPTKLKKLEDSLEAHKQAMSSWADSVEKSLVRRTGSISASR